MDKTNNQKSLAMSDGMWLKPDQAVANKDYFWTEQEVVSY